MYKYILEPIKSRELHAGTKAREDINLFLGNSEYKPILFNVNDSTKFLLKLKNYAFCMANLERILNKIETESIVLIQYPYFFNSLVIQFVIRKLSKKGVKLVALIHDIEALRFTREEQYIKEEIDCLNSFDCVISHNSFMTKWLIEHGLKNNIYNLELFDYSVKAMEKIETDVKSNTGRTIIFAGNLSPNKSKFLYKIDDEMLKGVNVNLYGIEFDEASVCCKNMFHKGKFEPDELPYRMEGDFGLIWDGLEANTCSGHYGQYMRFNNPHKLSLYLAAGLPVITWKNAAISDFVARNNIGVLVDSLTEIGDAIAEIDTERYLSIKENVKGLQQKVTSGHYIQNAVRKIEEGFVSEAKILNGL
jgi:glycosyltransferase involved in cell wall biosynthesis